MAEKGVEEQVLAMERLLLFCAVRVIYVLRKRKAGTYYEKWNQIYTETKAKTEAGTEDWQNTWNSTEL